jgi:hypothetical protein
LPYGSADELEPRAIFALEEGEQERWNRQCLLQAWSTWIIYMTIPSASKNDHRRKYQKFEAFLEDHPPPGYRRPKREK